MFLQTKQFFFLTEKINDYFFFLIWGEINLKPWKKLLKIVDIIKFGDQEVVSVGARLNLSRKKVNNLCYRSQALQMLRKKWRPMRKLQQLIVFFNKKIIYFLISINSAQRALSPKPRKKTIKNCVYHKIWRPRGGLSRRSNKSLQKKG